MSEVKIKSEPVDTGYENDASPAGGITGDGACQEPDSQNINSILRGILHKSDKGGVSVKNVIEDLLQKNEKVMAENDPGQYKPNTRTVHVKAGKDKDIVRPKSPTNTCAIPQKDLSHIGQTLVELDVYDEETEAIFTAMTHEMVCGVSSRAFLMTQRGVNIQTDMQFYWCNFCPYKTEEKQALLQHVMEHRFHCKFCKYQSFSRADVIRHASKNHENFRSTAESLQYCSFLPDFLQLKENAKKRKADENGERVAKRAKTKVASETMFEMEVDEVDDDNASDEETKDSVIVPRGKETAVPSVFKLTTPKLPTETSGPSESLAKPTPPPAHKPTPNKASNTVTVSSGLCWNCGYCEFVTLSQTFLKTHLNTQHGGKAHKYVAMLVSSQEEMNKLKERDNQMYLSPNPAMLLGSPSVSSSTDKDKPSSPTVTNSEKTGGNVADSDSDEEYIPLEEKKKYPLTYKCAHCNFNAPVCFKIKEHLLFKHAGCVLYALDMRAVKLKQKRYVLFCHRPNCSFTTKKTEEYLNHSESCTPWLEPGCPEKIDASAKKCLELTRNFSTKISQKAFQMSRNFKNSKAAEYACVHCSYTSNNNTRVKKHVLGNHKDCETVMRDLQASKMKKKTIVYFCKICLWETRQDGDLGVHLKEKHNEELSPSQTSIRSTEEPADKEPPPLMPKIVSVVSEQKADTPTSSVSSASDLDLGADDDSETEQKDETLDDLEIPDDEIQRMMDEFITDEASRGKSSGRPNRAAAAKASARVQAQGHSPALYRCLHCPHMNFGENLMKLHIGNIHPGFALRALDVKKKSVVKSNPYVCFCPQQLCKVVQANEESIAKHAEDIHSIYRDNPAIKAILEPFIPSGSSEKQIVLGGSKSSAQFECLYCSRSVQHNSKLRMRQHVLGEHPSEEIVFRDCLLRKARRACRVFMCGELTCEFSTTNQKEISLHKLAHEKAKIFECAKCHWFTTNLDTVGAHMAALHQGEHVSTIEINLELDDEGKVTKTVGGTVIKQEPE